MIVALRFAFAYGFAWVMCYFGLFTADPMLIAFAAVVGMAFTDIANTAKAVGKGEK